MSQPRIVIIGAGPTGLGAAHELHTRGYTNWIVLEANTHVGGLATSFRDEEDFVWDVGGHVLFSHYERFDAVIEDVLGDEFYQHQREAWIWWQDRWIPYPFQNHLHHLPPEAAFTCLKGVIEQAALHTAEQPDCFRTWLTNMFGKGICEAFLYPYNEKVWSNDLTEMDFRWIAERVSVVDWQKLLRAAICKEDARSWGPNSIFKFPAYGGTGEIYRRIHKRFPEHVLMDHNVSGIDLEQRVLTTENGHTENYDYLISTMPVNDLIGRSNAPETVQGASSRLVYNSGVIFGYRVAQPLPSTKCWMYFAEARHPIYRLTNFSHYSPNNVPGGNTRQYSALMAECSYPSTATPDIDALEQQCLQAVNCTDLYGNEKPTCTSPAYRIHVEKSYPIPTRNRDSELRIIQPYLEQAHVLSRGRFGGWLYEVGNMDHSFMQGVEAVHRILDEQQESVYQLR